MTAAQNSDWADCVALGVKSGGYGAYLAFVNPEHSFLSLPLLYILPLPSMSQSPCVFLLPAATLERSRFKLR